VDEIAFADINADMVNTASLVCRVKKDKVAGLELVEPDIAAGPRLLFDRAGDIDGVFLNNEAAEGATVHAGLKRSAAPSVRDTADIRLNLSVELYWLKAPGLRAFFGNLWRSFESTGPEKSEDPEGGGAIDPIFSLNWRERKDNGHGHQRQSLIGFEQEVKHSGSPLL
jgi:hypothetical protein